MDGASGGLPANSRTSLRTDSRNVSVRQSTRSTPSDHDADAVGDALDVAQDVRAEQDRAALPLDDLDQRFEEVAADDRVEAERRVVEDQQLGIGRDGQRERHLRLLAAGKAAEFLATRELEVVEDLIHEHVVPARVKCPREADRVVDRHPAVQRMPFGEVGDARACRVRQVGGVLAQQHGAARIGSDHAHEHLDGGRLAGPVAAQEAVDAALRHAEVERIDYASFAVVFRESLGDDGVGHGGRGL